MDGLKVIAVEGAEVQQGDLLVELEPFDLLERRAQAASNLAEQQAHLQELQAGFREEEITQAEAHREQLAAHLLELKNGPRKQEIKSAKARVDLAQAELKLAKLKHGRMQTLFNREAASTEEMDEADTALQVATANLTVREEELALLFEGTRAESIAQAEAQLKEAEAAWKLRVNGYRKEDIQQAEAAVQAAEAALKVIDAEVEELTVSAPVIGTIEAVDLQPGDLVQTNAPVISLLDHSHMWVRAFVPENRQAVDIGDKVTLTVDAFPDEEFQGNISYVARRAEFTPRNVQTSDERAKQVFRIKVELPKETSRLRPGMAVDVWLEGRE
ncbi:MAG: HlyD family efflux transporter periplasmic adaptor subunit [Planctomycetaceae bacterium]